jgi:thioredoxin-related protein
MIKTFTLLFATLFSLYGAELEWTHGYEEAMEKARVQKKNVMLLITTPTCRWCRKLESTTLKDEEVMARLSRDYIVVHVTRDVDDYPLKLETNGVPTTYFLDEKGQAIIKRVTGYWNAEDYLSFMDDVDYKLGRKTY